MDAVSILPVVAPLRTRRPPTARDRRAAIDLLADARAFVAVLPAMRTRRRLTDDLDALAAQFDRSLHELAADIGIDGSRCDRASLAGELGHRRRIAPAARHAITALAPVLQATLAGDFDDHRHEVADLVDRVTRHLELRLAFG